MENILAAQQFFCVECKIVAADDDVVLFTGTMACRKMPL